MTVPPLVFAGATGTTWLHQNRCAGIPENSGGKNAESAERGIGAALLEVEMWRMWAISDQQRVFFELIHNQPQDNWVVKEISQQ